MTTGEVPSVLPVSDAAAQEFRRLWDGAPDGLWWAPGRVNLIGEHTDYNDGFVLPCALPQGVAVAAARRSDRRLCIRSLQKDGVVTVEASELEPGRVPGWAGYVAGVVWALREAGHDVPGLDLVCAGDVPVGAGLSSSAAIECAVALACSDVAELDLDTRTLATLARRAENDFVGAPTGVMDQIASMNGVAGHLVFLDTRSLAVELIPFRLPEAGLALLVVDSKAPHALVEGEYAERRRSCEEGARSLGVPALRDVGLTELDGALARLGDDVVRRRVRHVVTENARVLAVRDLLLSTEDLRSVGPLLTESHASMRDDFEITVPQVDLAVDTALATGAHGARMTGGGFGGCVIALVDLGDVERVASAVEKAYAGAGFAPPACFATAPSDGARRLA